MKSMKIPKVSIIIPLYNVAPYLEACFASVLSQTMDQFELIAINDGSADSTGEIAEKFARSDRRIKVTHQPNGGPSVARNVGLDQAKGEYVCFIDGDDYVTKNMLEEMVRMIESSKADVCVGGIKSFRNLKFVPEYAAHEDHTVLDSHEASNVLLYEKGILNSQCAKLYRHSTIGNIRFDPDIAFGEDMYFNYNVFKAAKQVVISAFTPYYYLQRSGSVMRARFNEKRADSLLVAHKIHEDVTTNNREDLKDAVVNKLFTESVSIAGLIPLKDRRSDLFTNCIDFIDQNKFIIFNNSQVGRKNRLFSALAIFNKRLLINLLWIRNNVRRKIG